MGLVRWVLALAVVFSHVGPNGWLGDSHLAVQLFYMISGFLISFVLHRDPGYRSIVRFYVNRALRIYPVYWTVAAATLAVWLAGGPELAAFGAFNSSAQVLLAASNLAILGQDVVMFVKQQDGGLAFTRDFRWSDGPLWHGLLVPQAWSLSLELMFYLLAPFLLGRVKRIAIVAAVSATLTLIGNLLGFTDDPWSYRFFPFELSLFLLGSLSERILLPWARRHLRMVRPAPVAAVCLFVSSGWIGPIGLAATWTLCAAFAILLPFLFLFQHGRRWDVWIGDLSYPLYISHMLAITLVARTLGTVDPAHPRRLLLALVTAAMLTLAVEYGVNEPVERIRRRVRQASAPIDDDRRAATG